MKKNISSRIKRALALMSLTAIATTGIIAQTHAEEAQIINYTVVSDKTNISPVKIKFNADETTGYLYQSKTYAPLGLFRQLSTNKYATTSVDYDSETKAVFVYFKDGRTPDSKEMTVKIHPQGPTITVTKDGQLTDTVLSDVINVDGSLYLPLGIFRDYMGLEVIWDAEDKIAIVTGNFDLSTSLVPADDIDLSKVTNALESLKDSEGNIDLKKLPEAIGGQLSLKDLKQVVNEHPELIKQAMGDKYSEESFNKLTEVINALPDDLTEATAADTLSGLINKLYDTDIKVKSVEETAEDVNKLFKDMVSGKTYTKSTTENSTQQSTQQ